MLIAQGLEHGGGIFQDFCLFLQVGKGVHAAVGENDHLAQGGDLIEHTVGGQVGGAQAVLLVEYRTHQVCRTQNALHEEIRLAFGAQGHRLGGAIRVCIAGNNLIIGRLLAQTGQHSPDFVRMAYQDGGGDALFFSGHYCFDNGLIMSRRHSDDAALATLGGLHNALDSMDHK